MNKEKVLPIVVISIIVICLLGLILIKNNNKNGDKVLKDDMWILDVSSDFNKEEVLNSGYPALLDIGGGECIPCKAMRPVLEELNEEWNGKAIVHFIDYWKYPKLADQFNFSSIPTQFFYDKDGKLYTTHVGSITKDEVIDVFKEMGYDFNE